MTKSSCRLWQTHRALILLLLGGFLLRLPALAWPVISDDEAIYDAMAQVVGHGGVMYREAIDHKPPGLVYTYAFVQKWVTPDHGMDAVHLFGAVIVMFTALGLYFTSRELLERRLWLWPAGLYILASSAKCAYDGLALNGELMMNLPTILSVWAVLRGRRAAPASQMGLDSLAGVALGVSGLYKWQALITLVAFPLLAGQRHLWRRAVMWGVGIAAVVVATATFFNRAHALPEAIAWGLKFNLLYIQDGAGFVWSVKRLLTQLAAVVLPSGVLYLGGVQGFMAQAGAPHSASRGLVVWALLATACVGLGGRFFGHYFLQAELPLTLLAAVPVARLWQRAPRRTLAALSMPVVLFTLLGSSPRLTRGLLDSRDPDWVQIGKQIAAVSQPDEELFVWGNAPLIYHFAHRRMGTRFIFCNYLTGLSPGTPSEYDANVQPTGLAAAWPLLQDDLAVRRPTWILDTSTTGWKGYGKLGIPGYPALAQVLEQSYRPHQTIEGAVLYRRITRD